MTLKPFTWIRSLLTGLIFLILSNYSSEKKCPLFFDGYVDNLKFLEYSRPREALNVTICPDFNTTLLCCAEKDFLALSQRFTGRYEATKQEINDFKKYALNYYQNIIDYSVNKGKTYKEVWSLKGKLETFGSQFDSNIGKCLKTLFTHEASTTCLFCSLDSLKYIKQGQHIKTAKMKIPTDTCSTMVIGCTSFFTKIFEMYSIYITVDTGLRQRLASQKKLKDGVVLNRRDKDALTFFRAFKNLKNCIVGSKCAELC